MLRIYPFSIIPGWAKLCKRRVQLLIYYITNRLCHLCEKQDLEDEFHYVFQCSYFNEERMFLFPISFSQDPNMKLHQLKNWLKHATLHKLGKFLKNIAQSTGQIVQECSYICIYFMFLHM